MMKRTAFYGLLAASLLILTIPGCGKGMDVSNEAYNRIETGMSLRQVQRILGNGELQTGALTDIGESGGSAKVYKWTDGEKKITVTFLNNEVIAKTASGL